MNSKKKPSKEHQKDKELQKELLFIINIALFTDYFLMTVVIPIIPQVFTHYYSNRDIGYLFMSKPVTQITTGLFMGAIVEKCGATTILFVTTLVLAMSTGLFIGGLEIASSGGNIVTSFTVCLVGRAIQGIASSGIMSGGLTLIAKYHDESIEGTAMGIAMAGVAAGTVFGPPVGCIVSHFVNIETPFYIVVGILILNMLAQVHFHYGHRIFNRDHYRDLASKSDAAKSLLESYGTFKESKEYYEVEESNIISQANQTGGENGSDNEEHHLTVVEVLTSSLRLLGYPDISIVVLGTTLGIYAVGMLSVTIPLFLIDQYKYGKLDQGLIFAVLSLTYMIGSPVAGVLSDMMEKWKIFMMGIIFTGISLILLYWGQYLAVMIIALGLDGIGVCFIDVPGMALMSEISEARKLPKGPVFALTDMAACLGLVLGPIIGTNLELLVGFEKTNIILGSCLLLFAPFTYLLKSEMKAKKSEDQPLNYLESEK